MQIKTLKTYGCVMPWALIPLCAFWKASAASVPHPWFLWSMGGGGAVWEKKTMCTVFPHLEKVTPIAVMVQAEHLLLKCVVENKCSSWLSVSSRFGSWASQVLCYFSVGQEPSPLITVLITCDSWVIIVSRTFLNEYKLQSLCIKLQCYLALCWVSSSYY